MGRKIRMPRAYPELKRPNGDTLKLLGEKPKRRKR
jgi:hypothetical protein